MLDLEGVFKVFRVLSVYFVIQQLYLNMQKIFLASKEENISVLISPLAVITKEVC